jgi:hypothetical protein
MFESRSSADQRLPRAREGGRGALGTLREADPDFVAEDSEQLGTALRRVLDARVICGRSMRGLLAA